MLESKYCILSVLFVFILHFGSLNSKTSTMWKLDLKKNKIVEASPFLPTVSLTKEMKNSKNSPYYDPIFKIITSTIYYDQTWVKQGDDYYCTDCHLFQTKNAVENKNVNAQNSTSFKTVKYKEKEVEDESLDCGKPVNFTYYDSLVGIANRQSHPNVQEPQLSLILGSKKNFDINSLEQRLKKIRKEKPKSVHIYNQIGNFWRLKGDTQKAIECFRRGLAVSPHNSEILLNLARVLFTLQYLDDAIYLTRRSIEMQPPDKGAAWQQYFTLGEIFKAYGHYQEAQIHLKHTLDLKPGFTPAEIALKEMESNPTITIHLYTMVIIICLVFGVLLVILSSFDGATENEMAENKPQRHFNRAMAMSTLRGLRISQRNSRHKKLVA
ncbi:tetratricopeptide repeat protein 17-like [Agrilus planipennis]|uniref:Tetratricopeptide repeat protein 17-like n=1 Tax=Agrilus planipennis TaxID=224129 RepID=A0A1W4W2L2_AGRPL|nr:tetratricopeptide repeat protein 17-like [Agrilus planipennis]